MTKQAIREAIKAKRKIFCAEKAKISSLAAQKHIINAGIWQSANYPAIYAAMPQELPTDLLMQDALAKNKCLLLPKITSLNQGQMEFFYCKNKKMLKKGPLNIMEPYGTLQSHIPDLIIIPGLAFTMQGYRLGYGAGFYDRYLADRPQIKTLGLCYNWQVIKKIPQDEWDMPVQMLATEKGIAYL